MGDHDETEKAWKKVSDMMNSATNPDDISDKDVTRIFTIFARIRLARILENNSKTLDERRKESILFEERHKESIIKVKEYMDELRKHSKD
jgi:hypothetical protein